MQSSSHIRYIRRQDIDLHKWDACISQSLNGLIYARSFYLEYMTGGVWDALVSGEYEAVMPLTWKKKWGIRYLYQPPFTQQSGIFSPTAIPPELVEDFLVALTRQFRFAEIFMNFGNTHPSFTPATNLVLRLDAPYEQLRERYKKDLVKNLRSAARSSFRYLLEPDLSMTLSLYHRLYKDRMPHIRTDAYRRFEKLCMHLSKNEQVIVRGVAGSQGQLLGTALLLKDASQANRRLYLLQSSTLPAGRRTEANHFLLDNIIREFAGKPMILDFEGSDLPGIAHFYRNFGTTDQPYYFFRYNRLPWPLRLLK